MEFNNTLLEDRIKQVARGAGIIFLGTVVGRGLLLLSKVIIGRKLGPDEFGLFNLGFAVLMLSTYIALLGLQEGTPTFISRYRAKNELEKVKGTVFSSLKITAVSGFFLAVLIFLSAKFISIHLFHDERLIPVFRTFSIVLPFFSMALLLLSILRGFKLMKEIAFSRNLIGNVSFIMSLLVFLALNYMLFGAIIAYFVQSLTIIIAAWYFLKQRQPLPEKNIRSFPITQKLMRFSLPLTGSGALESLRVWTDTFFIGFFVSSVYVGYFNYGLIICSIFTVTSASFIVILLPINAELYENRNIKEMNRLYYTVSKWLFFLLLPFFLLVLLFPDIIISVVFGSKNSDVASILWILAIGYFVRSFTGIWPTVIYAIGKTHVDLYLKIAGTVTSILLNVYLIPKIGITGAAIAHTSSLLLMDCLGLSMVYRYTKIWPLSHKFLKYFLIGIIPSLGLFIMRKVFLDLFSTALPVVFLFGLYIMIYAIFVVKFIGKDSEDKLILNSIRHRIRERKKHENYL